MGLLDFFRRKIFNIFHTRASTAPRLKEIWSGFQQILASNNEIQGIIGGLEEMLAGPKDPDLPFLNSRVWVLDQHFAGLVAALQTISGGKYAELEEARVRIKAAIHQRLEEAAAADAPDPLLLRAVTGLIIPLNLVDRRSPTFKPENCRTYNDITRFAHEKAIQVMFGLMDDVAQGRVPALKLLKLKTALPLNLHLVDLGDGLASHDTPVPPEDIISRPMRALWQGIELSRHHLGRAGAGGCGRLFASAGAVGHQPPGEILGQDLCHRRGQLRQLRLPPGVPFPKRGQLHRRSALG